MSEDTTPKQQVDPAVYDTVEQLVRARLSAALGGRRGMVEGAVPTVAFTVCWITTHDLRVALGLGAGLAVLLLIVRLVQRQTPQFVLNSLFGIGIAALFAFAAARRRTRSCRASSTTPSTPWSSSAPC